MGFPASPPAALSRPSRPPRRPELLSGSTLNNSGPLKPNRPCRVPSGPLRFSGFFQIPSSVFSGPFRSFQVISGPFRSFQVLSGHFRSSQVLSGLFRCLRFCHILSVHLRCIQVSSSPLRSCQVPLRPLKFPQVLSDPLKYPEVSLFYYYSTSPNKRKYE